MKVSKKFLILGGAVTLVALVALATVVGVASAQIPTGQQTAGAGPVHLLGTVQSVNGTNLMLRARGGQVNVSTSANTWFVVQRKGSCGEGALADVQSQKPALVLGTGTLSGKSSGNQQSNGNVTARVVVQCPGFIRQIATRAVTNPAAGNALAKLANFTAAGTIKSISGTTITATTVRGADVTVNTTADTVVLNGGFQPVSSLKVGDKIAVLGRPERSAAGKQATATSTPTPATQPTTGNKAGPRTLDAVAIKVVNNNTKVVVGRVQSVNGNTLTLNTLKNKSGISVTLDGSTGYKAATIMDKQITLTNAVQSDVKAGSGLIVEGVPSAGGKGLSARAVIILPVAPTPKAK